MENTRLHLLYLHGTPPLEYLKSHRRYYETWGDFGEKTFISPCHISKFFRIGLLDNLTISKSNIVLSDGILRIDGVKLEYIYALGDKPSRHYLGSL